MTVPSVRKGADLLMGARGVQFRLGVAPPSFYWKGLVMFVRGFNPPVLVVKREAGMAYVVPASLPWACARLVREDALTHELRPAAR